jgi:hypothetical protein
MSGKRTTIEERDSTTEEERMAEVRARLFTLFDDDDEREREYAEQNGLKNRATGTFQKIKSIIGDGDEGYDEEAAARNSTSGSPGNKTAGGGGAERRRPTVPEQRRRRSDSPEREQTGKKRIEQEGRVRPVNPVRAMSAEKFERRGQPEPGEGDRARRPSDRDDDRIRARRPSDRDESEYAEPARARAKPKESKPERPAVTQRGYEPEETPLNKDRQPEQPDESFRLGDLFKDKEPDVFSRWEQEDETEKRIRERRERRRAEAARRGRGEDDDSKMKTAAALFIAREGVKNFLGKFSGAALRDQEQDEEERKAEEALRELAAARIEDGASSPVGNGNGTTARAAAAPDDDDKRDAQKADRDADRDSKASERLAAKAKTKAKDKTEKKKRPAAAAKDDKPQREKRVKDVETVTPKRSKKRAAGESRTGASVADANTAATEMKAASAKADGPERSDDDARPEPSLLDYFTGGARLSRGAIAWMAGGAAGSVAVVVIAIMIVNSHMTVI